MRAALGSLRTWERGADALMAFLERQPKPLIALAAALTHALVYSVPNHLTVGVAHTFSPTSFEQGLPFLPESVWVYLSDYVLVFVAFLQCRRPGATSRFIFAMGAVVAVGSGIHWAFPTALPRAAFAIAPGVDPATRWVLEALRGFDTPASCFPSLHVASSTLAALAPIAGGRPRWSPPLQLWALLVALSTLTLKQHYLVDVAGGFALAVLVYLVSLAPLTSPGRARTAPTT